MAKLATFVSWITTRNINIVETKLGDQWAMTSVRVQFVLIFAVVQLCTAEYGRLLRVENDLKRQSVNLNFVRRPDGVGF